ncbi:MAG TPA: DUF5946 family protein [Anaerolineales bacterium]|nr:DUF5946 family protein [Anaerolineales bacterium]
MNCPECGAPESICEARYHECLVKEFSDPGYGAVHHLTVATFMLQHSSKLTKEGWLYERELLRAFLVENKPPEVIRKQNRVAVDSGRRDWKIADRNGTAKIDRTTWTCTVLDVRFGSAEEYCADVKAWAATTLHDAEGLSVN